MHARTRLEQVCILIIVLTITCIFFASSSVSAAGKCPGCPPEDSLGRQLVLTYFYRSDDLQHPRTLRLLQAASAHAGYWDLVPRDMSQPEIQEVRRVLNTVYGVSQADADVVPAVFVGEQILVGYDAIKTGIWPLALARWQEASGIVGKASAALRKMKLLAVFAADGLLPMVVIAAGLLDGVNPCALSMLFFLLACLSTVPQRGRGIFVAGSGFIIGSFVAYLLIGLGILQLTRSSIFLMVSGWIYRGLGVISLVLGVLSILDFMRLASGGRVKDMRLQLPTVWKQPLHRLMRRYARADRVGVLVGVLLGALASLIEFPCTGQVYLPTVSLVGNSGSGLKPFVYLVAYNVAFILPLTVAVFASAHFIESQRVVNIYFRYLGLSKLLTAVLFFFISAYMFGLLV